MSVLSAERHLSLDLTEEKLLCQNLRYLLSSTWTLDCPCSEERIWCVTYSLCGYKKAHLAAMCTHVMCVDANGDRGFVKFG